jgi:hypothetical protein
LRCSKHRERPSSGFSREGNILPISINLYKIMNNCRFMMCRYRRPPDRCVAYWIRLPLLLFSFWLFRIDSRKEKLYS